MLKVSPTAGYKMMSVSDLVKFGITASPGGGRDEAGKKSQSSPKKGRKTPNASGSGSLSPKKEHQPTSRLLESLAAAAQTPPQKPSPLLASTGASVTPTTAQVLQAVVEQQQALTTTAELIKVHEQYQQMMRAKDEDMDKAMAMLCAKEIELAEAKARMGYEREFPSAGDLIPAKKKGSKERSSARSGEKKESKGTRR